MNNMGDKLSRAQMRICETGKQILDSGLVAGSWGNISCRLGGRMLITPSGVDYHKITPQTMALVDLTSGKWISGDKPSSELALHRAVYIGRPDIGAIVHTHSVYAGVLAVTHTKLPPILEDLAQLVGGEVSVAGYAPAGSDRLAENALLALGEKGAVLLANHGLVGAGRNLSEAFYTCQVVERAAQVYVLSKLMGASQALPAADVEKLRHSYLNSYRPIENDGEV